MRPSFSYVDGTFKLLYNPNICIHDGVCVYVCVCVCVSVGGGVRYVCPAVNDNGWSATDSLVV